MVGRLHSAVNNTARETPALDAVRESVKDAVEHDDLDVPTFIRRRGEAAARLTGW